MNSFNLIFLIVWLILGGMLVHATWPYLLCLAVITAAIYLGIKVAYKMHQAGYDSTVLMITPMLVVVLGVGVGFAYLGAPMLIPVGAVPLVGMILYPRFRHRRLVADYKRNARHLIQP